MTLASLARGVQALARKAEQSPIDFIAWLPYQIAWMSHTGPEPALLRRGNRQGKSWAGAGELIYRARGEHPFKEVPPGPVRMALVCFSLIQSIEIQRVLWELLGGEHNTELVPGTEFNTRTGFRGHRPVVQWREGSEIVIYGNAQGAGALAGAEYDYILLDEPPAQVVYDECRARVRNTGGNVGLTLTPINGPPLPWLRELCEAGKVKDYWGRLTPESQISPMTGQPRRTKDGTPWDKVFIDELRRLENPIDAPIRLDGEWESRSVGQFFATFDPVKHVSDRMPKTVLRLLAGFDYAAADRPRGLCFVLSGIETQRDKDGRETAKVKHALCEVVLPGNATMATFARRIIAELRALDLEWKDLDGALGDNPVKTRHVLASNRELMREIERQLGIPPGGCKDKPFKYGPPIKSAKEGGGASGLRRRSKDIRCRWVYGEFAQGRIQIHPRCVTLIEALGEWDYTDKHEAKDVLDGWMYGLRDEWAESRRYGEPAEVRVF